MLNRAKYTVLGLGVLAAIAFTAKDVKATIDPFTYLQPSYSYQQAIPNPHTNWGNIQGADGIENGTKAIFLWDSGMTQIYNSDMSTVLGTIDFGISNATGISEVPTTLFGYGANFAVSDSGRIFFFDSTGNYKGGKLVPSGNIRDITYDSQRGNFLVSTDDPYYSLAILNPDGTLTHFAPSPAYGIEMINLTEDNGNPIDDMLQADGLFYSIAGDGSITDGYITNLGAGLPQIDGIAYTKDKAIMAAENGMLVYGKLAFQDHMDYSVPEPATLALLVLGAGLAAANRRKYVESREVNK